MMFVKIIIMLRLGARDRSLSVLQFVFSRGALCFGPSDFSTVGLDVVGGTRASCYSYVVHTLIGVAVVVVAVVVPTTGAYRARRTDHFSYSRNLKTSSQLLFIFLWCAARRPRIVLCA